MCARGATSKRHIFGIGHFKHPHLGNKQKNCWHIWYRAMRAWSSTPKPQIMWHCAFQTLGIQKPFCWQIWGRGIRTWGATPKPRIFWHCAFQASSSRYPKTLLWEDLLQRYARLERHARTPHFLALRIPNIPILSIQKHLCRHIWCRGAPKPPNPLGPPPPPPRGTNFFLMGTFLL